MRNPVGRFDEPLPPAPASLACARLLRPAFTQHVSLRNAGLPLMRLGGPARVRFEQRSAIATGSQLDLQMRLPRQDRIQVGCTRQCAAGSSFEMRPESTRLRRVNGICMRTQHALVTEAGLTWSSSRRGRQLQPANAAPPAERFHAGRTGQCAAGSSFQIRPESTRTDTDWRYLSER